MPESQIRTLAELTLAEGGKLKLKGSGREVDAQLLAPPVIVRVPATDPNSLGMRELELEIFKKAPKDATAFLSGETGEEFYGRLLYLTAPVVYYRLKDTAPN